MSDVVSFKATYIGIGTYKFEPVGEVVVKESQPAMCIVVRDPNEPSKYIPIEIIPRFIVKTIFHFGSNSTLLFRVMQGTIENVQQLIRPNEDWSVAHCQWIIVKTSALSESDIILIRKIYMFFSDEITSDEMDEMVKFYTTEKSKVRRICPPHDKSSKSTNDGQIVRQILQYPPNGNGAISISVNDYERLASSEHLNDVIIDFYIKYLHNEILTPEQRQKTHIFSTFFYNALTARAPRGSITTGQLTAAQKRHERVKRWTKNVNIFEKDFIIIPVNQDGHWFLAIICFPGLKGPVNMKTGETVQAKKRTKPKTLAKRKTTDLNDDDIDEKDESEIAIKQPCILIFDSLGGDRSEEIDRIRDYLSCEYAAKADEAGTFSFDATNMPGSSVRVPTQPNLCDCGLFLLQYAEQFFMDPIKSYDLPIKGLEEWFEDDVATRKRKDIADLIKTKIQHEFDGFSVADLPNITLPK